jgi:hypothetical protein
MRLAAPYCEEFRIGKFNHTGSKPLQEFMNSIGYIPPTQNELIQFCRDAKKILIEHNRFGIFKNDLLPYLRAVRGSP